MTDEEKRDRSIDLAKRFQEVGFETSVEEHLDTGWTVVVSGPPEKMITLRSLVESLKDVGEGLAPESMYKTIPVETQVVTLSSPPSPEALERIESFVQDQRRGRPESETQGLIAEVRPDPSVTPLFRKVTTVFAVNVYEGINDLTDDLARTEAEIRVRDLDPTAYVEAMSTRRHGPWFSVLVMQIKRARPEVDLEEKRCRCGSRTCPDCN